MLQSWEAGKELKPADGHLETNAWWPKGGVGFCPPVLIQGAGSGSSSPIFELGLTLATFLKIPEGAEKEAGILVLMWRWYEGCQGKWPCPQAAGELEAGPKHPAVSRAVCPQQLNTESFLCLSLLDRVQFRAENGTSDNLLKEP